MCLITFAYKAHTKYSLILIANRDEFFQRPTQQMHVWQENKILAGRDLEQQGTWFGINPQGALATVTNYRDGRRQQTDALSRGQLTANFLKHKLTAAEYLHQLTPTADTYGGYNLLLGDCSGLYYHNNHDGSAAEMLQPGIYGLSNATLDTPWPKLISRRTALEQALQQPDPTIEQLLTIMQDSHEAADETLPDTGISHAWEKRLSASFIRSPEYGTRATTVLLQTPEGETEIIEQNYDLAGATERLSFQLTLPAIGSLET